MSASAARSVAECSVDVASDVADVRAGLSRDDLLELCLVGVESDDTARHAAWSEYVDAIMVAAVRP
jgi:hypothetical protein